MAQDDKQVLDYSKVKVEICAPGATSLKVGECKSFFNTPYSEKVLRKRGKKTKNKQ